MSIHKDISEQHFTVTSAKRVAVLQASLKVVREEVGVQFPNKDNKLNTPRIKTFMRRRML